jgi:hypothetical protein
MGIETTVHSHVQRSPPAALGAAHGDSGIEGVNPLA